MFERPTRQTTHFTCTRFLATLERRLNEISFQTVEMNRN